MQDAAAAQAAADAAQECSDSGGAEPTQLLRLSSSTIARAGGVSGGGSVADGSEAVQTAERPAAARQARREVLVEGFTVPEV